jgi:DNA-binding PadR family transcriptional regulator
MAKVFDVSVASFWTATPQQLYRELDRMAADGLIQSRVLHQERRPNKRLFSLTQAGRDAIHDFTARPPKPVAFRDELLVKVQAADAGDMRAVRDSVAKRLQGATAKLARYERWRSHMLNGRSDEDYLAEAERVGPHLNLLRGIAFEQENIRWAERALSIIDRRLSGAP